MASAIRASGLRRVVLLSSVGADLAQDSGMIGSMHDQEERLRAIDGLDAVFLWPGAFFENLDCAREGSYADAVLPDLRLPMVATRDIAIAAAAALLDPAWHGNQIRELLGPRDMSYAEAVAIINGKEDYVCIPYEAAQEGLVQAGFAPDVARLTVDIARAINEGRIKPLAGRTAANTTPTRYEDYVKGLS